ncbi:hypothetical protein BCR34DRAFT_522221 [Clohesyomyces aquaticus]|uniref:Uncharacterized protein n=1 Tax=Clohesyomyces aquaticus TaxID=1231657 RepID=A0A1Y1YSU6_9PLEO|nr:hypothetical protein BCR34DRAFT_522221 [Clohesyomyces aquaticus]
MPSSKMDIDSAEPRVKLPGFGHPVADMDVDGWDELRFLHAIENNPCSDGITLRERRMLEFMTQISDKPEWSRKVFDEAIVAKWKEEAVRWDETIPGNGDLWLSETMFECCMLELREKADVYEKQGFVSVLDCELAVVKADGAIEDSLKERLKSAVAKLENVPEKMKDWHPKSDDKVLDLVHPSLFPVVYGLTKVLPTRTVPLEKCAEWCGEGESTDAFDAQEYNGIANAWGSFQWLPSNLNFSPGGTAKISSYINNLHPKEHGDLYRILEQMVDASIPLWNECLSSTFQSHIRITIGDTSNEDYKFPPDVKFPRELYMDRVDPSDLTDVNEEDSDYDDEQWAQDHNCEDEYEEWAEQHRVLEHFEPKFTPRDDLKSLEGRIVDLRKDFADRGLQIIFKLANIHLTPEKPKYDGGSWHVEGSLNEHICATAIYYYDCDNLTDSHLAFRTRFNTEEMTYKPAQSEYSSLEAFYGIEQEGPATLELGSVLTRPDRLLAFPNTLQHCVRPFSLVDKSRSGHRKILAMFLIDPHTPILSTANVPPQRKDWWAPEVRKISLFESLPKEIFDMIIDQVTGFPMGWEEAVAVRERLMSERGMTTYALDEAITNDTFFFCEH